MLKENYIKKLYELDKKLISLEYAQALISWDSLTLAPKKSVTFRSNALSGLANFYFATLICEETNEMLTYLTENGEQLNDLDKAKVRILKEEYNKIAKIPPQEYADYKALISESSVAWENAKNEKNYQEFSPFLEKVIEFQKRYINYQEKEGHPYNTLLDDYEKGLTVEITDNFFDFLKEKVVPLVKKKSYLNKDKINDIPGNFAVKKQAEFSYYLMEKLGFRMDCGVLAESEHPFTINLSRDDVRITTHYYEDNLLSSILSTIHETGHAIYEQNIDKNFGSSVIASGASMGIHESQSRIFENNFGRSLEFWEFCYPKLKSIFPELLKDIDTNFIYKALNFTKPSLIRIEADELTYPLHIMIRYEIEKMIFEEKVKVKDLPELWNSKYEEYLGIRPGNDAEGILQDVHWSEGLFGYFPSYALGSAYAVQFRQAIAKNINIENSIKIGNFSEINNWLTNNIHQFGRTKTPSEIILAATGEKFNPKYYVDYLTSKFN